MAQDAKTEMPPPSNLRERIAQRRRERSAGWKGYTLTAAEWDRLHPPRIAAPVEWRNERKPQKLYFIQALSGPIKIGIAADLKARLKTLQTAHFEPLTLIAAVDGGGRLEREYHARFAQHRLVGEWFTPAPDILAEIERLNTGANQ